MSDSEILSLEYDVTAEDWAAAWAHHWKDSRLLRGTLRRARATAVGASVMLAFLMLLVGSSLPAAAALVAGVVYAAFLPRALRKAHKRQLDRQAADGLANGTLGPHRVSLTEYGILDATTGYECLVKWDSVERVEEADGALLIYNGPNSFLPVPVSAFRDQAQLRAFSDRFFHYLAESDRLRELAAGDDETPT